MSLVRSRNAQLPYIDTSNIFGTPGAVAAAWGAGVNVAVFAHFRLSKPIRVNKGKLWIGTAAGNVDFAVASVDLATLAFTRLASSGSTVAAGASALQTFDLGGTIWLPSNTDLVVGCSASTASLNILRHSVANAWTALGQAYSLASAVPIPASGTLVAGTPSGNFVPAMWLGFE